MSRTRAGGLDDDPFLSHPIYLTDANGVATQLAAAVSLNNRAPPMSYALSGGWTAFTKMSGELALAYTRSPCGVIAQVGVLNTNHTIFTVNPKGEVIFTAGGAQYIGRAGAGIPVEFPGTVYRDGWYTTQGHRLLYYGEGPLTDAGAGSNDCVDGGGGDDAATIDAAFDASDAATGSADVSQDTGAPDAGPRDGDSLPPDGEGPRDVPRADAPPQDGAMADASVSQDAQLDARASSDVARDTNGGSNPKPDAADEPPSSDDGCNVGSISPREGEGARSGAWILALIALAARWRRDGHYATGFHIPR